MAEFSEVLSFKMFGEPGNRPTPIRSTVFESSTFTTDDLLGR